MVYSGIDFFAPEEKIYAADIRYSLDPHDRVALLVQVRELQGFGIEYKENHALLHGVESKDMGIIWFDGESSRDIEQCVVVGMSNKLDEWITEDADKIYYILIVQESSPTRFERIAAGTIAARCE
jgi:hypothetical protein